MPALAKLAPILGSLLLACTVKSTPPPAPPSPRRPPPVVEPVVTPKPTPDPATQRRKAAKERLELLTMAPQRGDTEILERLAGVGCVNLLHNSNRRAGACASGLRRSCPPSDRNGPEAEALARTSWGLLNRVTVAISQPRAWAEAQRCATHLIDPKHVAALTVVHAQRLSGAKHYQALLACLSRCRLSKADKQTLARLEGGRGTAARVEGRVVEAEEKLKSMKTIEQASSIFSGLAGTRKRLAARKAVSAKARAEFTARLDVVEKAIKAAAPALARAGMNGRTKSLSKALAAARKLLQVRDSAKNIAGDAPAITNMLSTAKELVVDIETIGGKPVMKGVAGYKRRLRGFERQWTRLEPKLKKRAAQLAEGESTVSSACSLLRQLRTMKPSPERSKIGKSYWQHRRKLRKLRVWFRPKKDCAD